MATRPFRTILVITVVVGGFVVKLLNSAYPTNLKSAATDAAFVFVESPATGSFKMDLLPVQSASGAVEAVSSYSMLSMESSTLLREQIALQLLAKEADLQLTTEQWADIAAVALNTQAIRNAYEASVARVTRLERGRYRLEIPAYPSAGDALRARFYADLREKLGGSTADAVVAQMGSSLEGYFAGFGVGVQMLDFTADPMGAESDYQVTRTVTFWNSVEAKNHLTTRRETHFPGLEDPSGHAWGPYLSLLAARLAEKVGS